MGEVRAGRFYAESEVPVWKRHLFDSACLTNSTNLLLWVTDTTLCQKMTILNTKEGILAKTEMIS